MGKNLKYVCYIFNLDLYSWVIMEKPRISVINKV